jgi:hypothetical protein
MVLHTMKSVRIWQVFPLVDEGLPNLVIGLILQVFGGTCRHIDHGKAGIVRANEMPFDQLHQASSCAWNSCTTFSVFRVAAVARSVWRNTRRACSSDQPGTLLSHSLLD